MALGPLIIVSGPSGSGKSTVIGRVLRESGLPLHKSVSATTREPRVRVRDGAEFREQTGVEYHFWDRERFLREVQAGAFLEWAEVHGRLYGTLRAEVDPYRARGVGVLLDIDVQGADQIRRQYPDCVTVFLRTSRFEDYEQRLRARGTEGEAAIQTRLATARRELLRAGDYRYEVINDDLEAAVARLGELVAASFPKSTS
jgi:guanylate kinase